MNHSTPFYIVDVFAENKYEGNQLAVVRGGAQFSDELMQKIAKEMNYSETTFIVSEKEQEDGYAVRIFTPEEEIPFAGHPTLGTAYIIQKEIIRNPVSRVTLNLKAGQIPVDFNYQNGEPGYLWMTQLPPIFGETFDAGSTSAMLNLAQTDIDARFPVQVVSTGTPFILVPLMSLDAVKRARLNVEIYLKFIADISAKAVLLFAPETYHSENDMNVRLFADYFGVPEDPATGSANGCLAGYLAKYRYWGEPKIDMRVEQGYEIGRPSLLLLKAEDRGGKIFVQVGGRVVPVAHGNLY
jgi:trans-2,3-dihydro-3-hydroxyanthranilate isomerase